MGGWPYCAIELSNNLLRAGVLPVLNIHIGWWLTILYRHTILYNVHADGWVIHKGEVGQQTGGAFYIFTGPQGFAATHYIVYNIHRFTYTVYI